MRVWIGEPDPQSVVWVYHSSAKTKQDRINLIKTINDYGYEFFSVDLYSVDDLYWVKELHEEAEFLSEAVGVKFIIKVHVHGNDQEVVDFINKSPYLEYVPIVRVK